MPHMPAIRSTHLKKRGLLRQRMEGWLLPTLLLCAFVFLYLRLFHLPFTPIFNGGDENLFLLDATRMLDGEMIYRDFFSLTTPGLELVNLSLLKLFGMRAWVSSFALIVLGLSLTSLIVIISRKVLSGGAAYLPGVLFLTFLFGPMLDDTHQWYTALAELGAVSVIIEKRTPTRLLAAGAFCGLASFFTQTQGVFALVGVGIFLLWEGRKAGEAWQEISMRSGYLLVSFVTTVIATDSYFAWKAGLSRFLYCVFWFTLKFYRAHRAENSLAVLVLEIPQMTQWNQLPALGVYLFIHALLPLVYVLFWMRYRRQALLPEHRNRLMLLNIMGLLLFASVVPAPSTYRMGAIAPLGLILLVWLIRGRGRLSQVLTVVLWVVALCVAVVSPLRIQAQKMRCLDLPRGRMALDPVSYEKFLWLSKNTVPGEYIFTAAGVEILFPLALRNPAEVPFVKTNNYTRPEQVRNIIAGLERNRVRFVLSDPELALGGNNRWKGEPPAPPRGHWRSFFHVVKSFLLGDYRSGQDNLGPFRNYLAARYHLARILPDSSEVWERTK